MPSTSGGSAHVLQQNHYYPFGLRMSEISYTGGTDNIHLYNGKELQEDFDLDWYDYGARFYDPALASWHSVDPRAEKYYHYSPYTYTLNNPMRFIDPDGMQVYTYEGSDAEAMFYVIRDHYNMLTNGGSGLKPVALNHQRLSAIQGESKEGEEEDEDIATNGGGYYPEGSYSYDKTHIQYLPAEGIGLLGGWSNVRGNAKVYRGSDGKYYANVSATGYTPASTKGTVNFSGSVDVLFGNNKVISSHSLHPFSGSSIIQSGRQDVGSAVFALPNVNNDVYLKFNVGYSYSEGVGYAVPIPEQGHYNIQVGFTIDAWTY
jgi:RHS repeat-associated protein